MDLLATITKVEFQPMTEIVDSELYLWADVPALGGIFLLETEKGSIEWLSQKFGLIIIGDRNWDVRPIEGKRCVVRQTSQAPMLGLRFLHYAK